MDERRRAPRTFEHLSREALYNTRAVAQTTEIPADTFRAWERRYGFPRPYRARDDRRLYSERDIGVILWLRDRTAEGMTISQAIQRLRLEHPDVFDVPPRGPEAGDAVQFATARTAGEERGRRHDDSSSRFVDAVLAFDDGAAGRVLDEALSFFDIEHVCGRVIQPALGEILDRRERGEIPAGLERFATRLVMRRLAMIFSFVNVPVAAGNARGVVMAACAPQDLDEVGLMVISISLARRGWHVIYIGAGVLVPDLIETARLARPDAVCLSSSALHAVEQALGSAARLLNALSPAPVIACCGRAFNDMPNPGRIRPAGVHLLNGTPDEISAKLARLVGERRAARAMTNRHA